MEILWILKVLQRLIEIIFKFYASREFVIINNQ